MMWIQLSIWTILESDRSKHSIIAWKSQKQYARSTTESVCWSFSCVRWKWRNKRIIKRAGTGKRFNSGNNRVSLVREIRWVIFRLEMYWMFRMTIRYLWLHTPYSVLHMCEPVIQQKDVSLLPSPDFLLLMIQLAFGELISVTPIGWIFLFCNRASFITLGTWFCWCCKWFSLEFLVKTTSCWKARCSK